jgi:hypothetical protein
MLETRKFRLNALTAKRDKLARKLQELDRKISLIGGRPADGKTVRRKTGRKRPKNTKRLLDVITDVLGTSAKGYTLAELSTKILEVGYKTNSANFPNTVYQCLYNNSDKFVYDAETKLYVTKAPKAAKPKPKAAS